MKPNFALSLSFEGIGLLKRVADGWHLLGDVKLDSADLAADLAGLRALGETLAPDDFSTVVVLPNDQIKYLRLETGRARDAKRWAEATTALEAETPYSADQLCVAILAQGRITEVAAVARETLDEAEGFAMEHAFNPVRFSAIPPKGTFGAAPDFGPTKAAATGLNDVTVTHDDVPIKIVSMGALDPAPAADPVPEPEPPAETVEPVDAEDLKGAAPIPEAPPEASAAASPVLSATPDAPVEQVSFASIRAKRDAPEPEEKPELGGAQRTSVGANAPGIPGETGPTSDRALRFDPAKAIAGLRADAGPDPEPDAPYGAPAADTETPSSSFLSRRSKRPAGAPDAIAPETQPKTAKRKRKHKQLAAQEQQKMTVFGARAEQEVGGKPRYLGLVMTLALLLFLAAVALWATLFVENGVAGLFKRAETPKIVQLDPEAAVIPETAVSPPSEPDPQQTSLPDIATVPLTAAPDDTAALQPDLPDLPDPANPESITDSAEVEAMIDEAQSTALNEIEAEARYAVTGIWERAPQSPLTPGIASTEDLYTASIDRALIALDAVALPAPESFLIDQPLVARLNPVASGTTFDLDPRGLVVATATGALSPEGIRVFLGKPPVLPASLPDRSAIEPRALSPSDETRIAAVRPRTRPDDLAETSQRATLGGLTRSELAGIRPKLRPTTEKDAAEADQTPTKLAVLVSKRPRQRPSNIAQLAQRSKPAEAVVAVPAVATVTPKIPTTASVARQATIQNAINLKKINLIGVYGTSSNRRALVRLASGRYKKVQIGDRIDGGKVAAIGDQELRYVKSGKNIVLKMPKG